METAIRARGSLVAGSGAAASGAEASGTEASGTEASGTEQPPRLSAAMADTFGELVDTIAATDRILASVSAARAELIDQARQWSEITEAAADSPMASPPVDSAATGNLSTGTLSTGNLSNGSSAIRNSATSG